MKNAKILSPLRFYKNLLFKSGDGVMKEVKDNKDIVIFLPIISSLILTILSLIAFANTFILTLTSLFIIAHLVVFTKANKYVLNRKREAERLKKEKEYEERFKQYFEYYRERMRREKVEQERKTREEAHHRYQQQSNSVDQNIVNAMKLLGLQKGFTEKDLKSSYRRLSKLHHPDMGGLEVNFKKLNTSYNYLMERM